MRGERPTWRTVVVLSLAALLPVGAGAQTISNPELFDKSLEAATQALSFYGPYENRVEARRVADLGYRVAAASGFREFPFSFYLIDMPVPNAFALPGGQIFLTRGMLDLGLDDDMLANLLGHEIAHVVGRHGMRMQKRATLLNILSTAVLAGVAITADNDRRGEMPDPYGTSGRRPNNDRVMGAAATGMVVSELLLRNYSREFEDESDEEGQRYAAGAGYDPAGAGSLMALMGERLPESKEFGYWRTHPFFSERVQAAGVRAELLKIQDPKVIDDYRQATQRVLLEFVPPPRRGDRAAAKRDPEERTGGLELPGAEASEEPPLDAERMLEMAALGAWPVGPEAERIRLDDLHWQRDRELKNNEMARDFGRLERLYEKTATAVAELDPDSPLLAAIEREIGGFERSREALYPKARAVLAGGVYVTGFLETFLSNYPDAPEVPAVRLELGDAYSRLGRQADAVTHYLAAWRSAPDSEEGRRARTGLKVLAPRLETLGALQELALQEEDRELRDLASRRLADRVAQFKTLANGANYLKRYPAGEYATQVSERIDLLADNLYGEVVLYQTVGDYAKALDRIQRILTEAPLSPAAKKLRDRAVFES